MRRLLLGLGAAAAMVALAEAASSDEVRCLDDAVLVFDGSGSMAGTDLNTQTPHIAKVRAALQAVLPSVAPRRHLGLMVYGPGPRARCENIDLRLRPGPNSAETIMGEVNAVVPAGETPLSASVRGAAEVLGFRERPAVVVLLTDGDETCGGDPCELARQLRAEAAALTIHVIRFKVAGSATWLASGTGSACMAQETGGLSLSAETKDELVAVLQKTLTCPLFSKAGQ